MSDSRTLEVIINGQNNLGKALSDADSGTKALSDRWGEATAASEKFTAGVLAAGTALGAFLGSSIESANEAERAQKRLETLMANVTGVTRDQVRALEDLASVQMRKTTLDDDTIKTGMSQLATFQLQADTIATLTPAMDDLAVAVNGVSVKQEDMISIGNLMGKAMQGNVTAMQRYGVSMSEAQKEIMKTGDETQRAATMVEILRQNYGGLAQGMKLTTEGAMESAKVAFGELKETIGGLLQPAVRGLAADVEALAWRFDGFKLDDLAAQWTKYHETIVLVAGAMAGMMTPALIAAAGAAGAFVLALAPFAAAGMAVAYAAPIIAQAWNENWHGMRGVVGEASQAVTRFAEQAKVDVYLVAAATKLAFFGAFYAAINVIEFFWIKYGEQLSAGGSQFREWADRTKDQALALWTRITEVVSQFWTRYGDAIIAGAQKAIEFGMSVVNAFVTAYLIIHDTIEAFWDSNKVYIELGALQFLGFLANVRDAFIVFWFNLRFSALKFWSEYGDNITEFWNNTKTMFGNIWKQLGEIWEKIRGPLGELIGNLEKLGKPIMELGGWLLKVGQQAFEGFATVFLKGLEVTLPVVINLMSALVRWFQSAVEWINNVLAGIDNMLKKWDNADFSAKGWGQFWDGVTSGNIGFATGGIVHAPSRGDVVPSLLRDNEEVLTPGDSRHSLNGGSGGGSGLTVNVNGTFYGADKAFAQQIGDMLVARISQQMRFAR